MPQKTLFSLDREPINPSPDRREPVLWLKRLVVLSSMDSSAVIRDIEFRRGLNIIQTRQMESSGGPVAGHSVGKTLLMRLIRYTLGEAHFGTDETQKGIAAIQGLESAVVVGHWRVDGADWIVVRPMREAKPADSFAARGDSWQEIVDTKQEDRSTFREFVNTIQDAALADLPSFTLPRGREANWSDVLAWLSRDYQCGYRRANEWRHDDSNSGPSLDREENSQIMQWLLGLMSPEEVELRLKHRDLLKQRAEHKKTKEREEKRLETLQPALWEKLELDEEAEIVDGQRTFASISPHEVVTERITLLKELKSERIDESSLAELEMQRDATLEKVTDIEAEIRSCRNPILFFEKQIKEYERDPLQAYSKCQADPCWMKERAKEVACDCASDDHLTDLRSQLDEQRRKLSANTQAKRGLQEELAKANGRVNEERARLAAELSGIDMRIGRWESFLTDVRAYQSVVKSASQADKALTRVDGDINQSLKAQDHIRSTHSHEVSSLTGVYQHILQQIFGEAANGRIQVDGNGLQPVPDKKLAPAGAALSVMTTVLAFDIACVAASVSGVGQHPRFLMHDSPREGDMEGPLFRRLFEVAADLEHEFADEEQVSFQYIVTTTTAPPEALSDEDGPYVRETLHSLDDNGLLLKKRF